MLFNWILRFKNKVTLTALIGAAIALVYQLLAMLGITPAISESEATETAGLLINLLVMLGIVVDPTTAGIPDSLKVMAYTEPRVESEVVDDEDGDEDVG